MKTCFAFADELGLPRRTMTRCLLPMLLAAMCQSLTAWAGGTVTFANYSANMVTNGLTGQPVNLPSNVYAALYWAPLGSNTLVQIGPAVRVGAPVAGVFAGGTRTSDAGTAGGEMAQFLVRAWDSGFATYEQALQYQGVLAGQSQIVQLTTGNPAGAAPTPPTPLVAGGLQGFTLTPNINGYPLVVLYCSTNKAVECGSAWDFDAPTAAGGCSSITITVLKTVTNGICPQIITRTWAATDTCGSSNSCSQVVTLVDTTPPVLICANNKTVQCGGVWDFDLPLASDACSGANVALTVAETVTNGTCPQVSTRTWVAADLCGNTNACSQTVTVVDTTPPVLVCGTNKTVQCGSVWDFDPPVASDACSGANVALTVAETVTNGTCPQVITRTWVAADPCGNTNTGSQTVTVVDTTPPVLVCGTNKTVQCGSVWDFDLPIASDACSGANVALTVVETVTNGTCPQVITRTWVAADLCGNTNTGSQIVTVVDTTPPILVCGTNKTVQCGSSWDFDPPSASDTCNGASATLTILDTLTNAVGACTEVVTRTWVATNACSGQSVTGSQSVTVVCSNCAVLALTKGCPPNPVPIGGLLAYSGTVSNVSSVVLTNVFVVNNQPAADTMLLGPITLEPGADASFSVSYRVPPGALGPYLDTLTASGTDPEGADYSNSLTAECPGTGTYAILGDLNGDGIVDQEELNTVLSNYWAHSQWVCMTNTAGLGGTNVTFALTNTCAWGFSVLMSTDLVDWAVLPGQAAPLFQFADPAATNQPQRFYRLRWP